MHPELDNTPSRTSANGSPIPCFTGTCVGRLPHTPPSGRPLDRLWVRPQTPIRGLLPSRPPEERGEIHPSNINPNPVSENARMDSC